jgi:hypothetical protein
VLASDDIGDRLARLDQRRHLFLLSLLCLDPVRAAAPIVRWTRALAGTPSPASSTLVFTTELTDRRYVSHGTYASFITAIDPKSKPTWPMSSGRSDRGITENRPFRPAA